EIEVGVYFFVHCGTVLLSHTAKKPSPRHAGRRLALSLYHLMLCTIIHVPVTAGGRRGLLEHVQPAARKGCSVGRSSRGARTLPRSLGLLRRTYCLRHSLLLFTLNLIP